MSNNYKVHAIGDYVPATIRSWEMNKTKTGAKYVRIVFSGGITKTLWASSKVFANPKSAKIFWDTLSVMGFRGSNLTMLAQDGALNVEQEYSLEIKETREYDGKTYYKAGFVNKKFKAGFKENKMTDNELNEFDIDASMYIEDAIDTTTPSESSSQPDYNISTDANFAASDIPF